MNTYKTDYKAYVLAVLQAAREINLAKSIFLPTFDQTGWGLGQVLDEELYPD
ncbi:hypothetical protein TAO_0147 [Candidatus Nitrosoglobus terrae]|uniref:Uncharacterized protein n=1 Tax=Candidatus Nitrosoglobus terrae TaxID=1630141 RepID=A0A1Q2SK76_9GAMM|nr:hypothetical protein [Candidatus Nitrosoglobus terrae]BAW79517.1 hypothetical protein TAO_0147 [Candidatus Nitrosoglobus terrae]